MLAAERGHRIARTVQYTSFNIHGVSVRSLALEGHTAKYSRQQLSSFRKKLYGVGPLDRFEIDSFPVSEPLILELRLHIATYTQRVIFEVYEYGTRHAGLLFESRYLFARSVVEDTPCFYALKRITAVIHEADDGPAGKIGDFGVHLLDAYVADLEVVLVVERGVEVEHPAGISPQGVVSRRQGIGEGYSVGKAEGVAFDLLREDKTSPLVDQIDIDKVGQSIPSGGSWHRPSSL